MEEKLYEKFSVREFLDDEDFIRCIKYRHEDDVAFWKRWKLIHPEREGYLDIAEMQLVLILSPKAYTPPKDFKENLLSQINSSINNQTTQKNRRRRVFYGSLAASTFAGIACLVFWYFTSTVTVSTGFGEFKTLNFSDSTHIKLNANSRITYRRAYAYLSVRDVTLEGEALFNVAHLAKTPKPAYGELFRVRTGLMEVTVLGTEFNVKERHGRGQVALIRGGVRVTATKSGQTRLMKPGEILEVAASTGTFDAVAKHGISPVVWSEGKLTVNQTSVKEILTAFEDLYGYRVILDNPALAEKKIDGSISIKSEQGLLFTLSNILNVNIKKEGKTIRLETRR